MFSSIYSSLDSDGIPILFTEASNNDCKYHRGASSEIDIERQLMSFRTSGNEFMLSKYSSLRNSSSTKPSRSS